MTAHTRKKGIACVVLSVIMVFYAPPGIGFLTVRSQSGHGQSMVGVQTAEAHPGCNCWFTLFVLKWAQKQVDDINAEIIRKQTLLTITINSLAGLRWNVEKLQLAAYFACSVGVGYGCTSTVVLCSNPAACIIGGVVCLGSIAGCNLALYSLHQAEQALLAAEALIPQLKAEIASLKEQLPAAKARRDDAMEKYIQCRQQCPEWAPPAGF
jgi:hypothetical protein